MDRADEARADHAVLFLASIGIPLRRTGEVIDSFLPGVWIDHGTLVYNYDTLRFPGDLYHEAGHLAVIPSRFRHLVPKGHGFDGSGGPLEEALEAYMESTPFMRDDCTEDLVYRAILQMSETEAIAWSYAAMVAAGEDAKRCFIEDDLAYNGGGEEVYLMLATRGHLGINGLQAVGMTTTKTYPTLTRWLQL